MLYSDDIGGSSNFGAGRIFTAEKLRYFIVEASELARQNEASQFGPRQHLSAARTALRLGREVIAFS